MQLSCNIDNLLIGSQQSAESDQLDQSAEQMLRHSPEFQGRLDLRTVFNQRKNFYKSFKVKQLKKPQHPEGLTTQRRTGAQHNQTTHQWAAS